MVVITRISEMAINATVADIEKLALARDVLQEQIDERIAARKGGVNDG